MGENFECIEGEQKPEELDEIADLLDEWAGLKPMNSMQQAIIEAFTRGRKGIGR